MATNDDDDNADDDDNDDLLLAPSIRSLSVHASFQFAPSPSITLPAGEAQDNGE